MKKSKQFPPTDDIEFKDSNNSDLLNNLNSNPLLKNNTNNQNQNEKPVVLPKPPSIVQGENIGKVTDTNVIVVLEAKVNHKKIQTSDGDEQMDPIYSTSIVHLKKELATDRSNFRNKALGFIADPQTQYFKCAKCSVSFDDIETVLQKKQKDYGKKTVDAALETFPQKKEFIAWYKSKGTVEKASAYEEKKQRRIERLHAKAETEAYNITGKDRNSLIKCSDVTKKEWRSVFDQYIKNYLDTNISGWCATETLFNDIKNKVKEIK
jgi:hypothetical protein